MNHLNVGVRIRSKEGIKMYSWGTLNQDISIWVDGNLVGWKESGGFAGTFSPNAAFVQSVIAVPMNTSPGLTLQWKTNIDARPSGARIFAGAGPIGGRYSPTRLSAEIICS